MRKKPVFRLRWASLLTVLLIACETLESCAAQLSLSPEEQRATSEAARLTQNALFGLPSPIPDFTQTQRSIWLTGTAQALTQTALVPTPTATPTPTTPPPPPSVRTGKGSTVTYTGPLQAKSGDMLDVTFKVMGPAGAPGQGPFFATLGLPNNPGDPSASHNNGFLDPKGAIQLRLEVRYNADVVAKLFFSYEDEVHPIADIMILPPCGGTC